MPPRVLTIVLGRLPGAMMPTGARGDHAAACAGGPHHRRGVRRRRARANVANPKKAIKRAHTVLLIALACLHVPVLYARWWCIVRVDK